MAIYRCYFLDGEDHIRDTDAIEAYSLSDAIKHAKTLLHRRSYHHAVELWLGPNRLFVSEQRAEEAV